MVEPADLRYYFSIPHQKKIQDFFQLPFSLKFGISAYRVSIHEVNIQVSMARFHNLWVY